MSPRPPVPSTEARDDTASGESRSLGVVLLATLAIATLVWFVLLGWGAFLALAWIFGD